MPNMKQKRKANNQIQSENERVTIGCILGRLDDTYQQEICAGFSDFAKKNDINVIYYAGRPIKIPNPDEVLSTFTDPNESLCNEIFNLINSSRVDGLVILAGTIGQFIQL